MNQKTLTHEQLKIIVLALLGIEPNLKFLDSNDYTHSIDHIQIEPPIGAQHQSIEAEFFLTQTDRWSRESTSTLYSLYISYYEADKKINPAIIALIKSVDNEESVEILGNLALVTDKLREWEIWQ